MKWMTFSFIHIMWEIAKNEAFDPKWCFSLLQDGFHAQAFAESVSVDMNEDNSEASSENSPPDKNRHSFEGDESKVTQNPLYGTFDQPADNHLNILYWGVNSRGSEAYVPWQSHGHISMPHGTLFNAPLPNAPWLPIIHTYVIIINAFMSTEIPRLSFRISSDFYSYVCLLHVFHKIHLSNLICIKVI